MISIAFTAATLVLAQYGGSYGAPPSSSYGSSSAGGVDTAPFVQLEHKCLDQAVTDTGPATQDVKQQGFDKCLALHDAMVKHATANLSGKESANVKRDLDHALLGVEKNYAKKLGLMMPAEVK
ncbi:hypothetical protein [Sphingomonas alba]|uniref:Uncharacterized protein n=1 Tax=Sphingomonas alba TaxID=2908208 RepID=A0ABT0RM36_9SPHN|nr:hypothetical protein [Sphingomonas alba]MCL6683709.1 hypothetical protein [Sphingomonas alba]